MDEDNDIGCSEFSWAGGLVPEGLEDAPPKEGGMYCGLTPYSDPVYGIGRHK